MNEPTLKKVDVGRGPARRSARTGHAALAAAMLALCGWALWAPVGADEAARVVGWVDGFEGAAQGYALERQGQTIEVVALMPLRAGDNLLVRNAAGRIRIHLGESAARSIERSGSPFRVPAGGETPTPWANLMDWTGSLLGGNTGGQPTTQVKVFSRGNSDAPPSSALLYTGTALLAAGRRPLALAWTNGKPPFRVQLTPTGAGQTAVVALDGLAEPICSTPEVDLVPGTYRLEIRDAQARDLLTEIRVVSTDALPRPDPSLIPQGVSDEARRTLSAAWLAGRDGGWVWRLEAYQRVVGLRGYDPAVRFGNRLQGLQELAQPEG